MDPHAGRLTYPDADGYVWQEGDFPKWGVMLLFDGGGRICLWEDETGYGDFY